MSVARSRVAPAAPERVERHVLGMAEMGYRGLSEQWLMRRAGDIHWRLIADACGQGEAVFACAEGRPLYAAFCLSSLRLDAPAAPRVAGGLEIAARLWRVGRSRLGSEQVLRVEDREIGRIRLVSTFVGRADPASNLSIVRRMPRVMALPPEAPPALARLALQGLRAAKALPGIALGGPAQELTPCPATDFNAARLLYFPSYAALTDRADFAAGGDFDRLLAARDVVYAGNVEPREAVRVVLRPARGGHLARIEGSDGRPLALLRSRFAPVPDA